MMTPNSLKRNKNKTSSNNSPENQSNLNSTYLSPGGSGNNKGKKITFLLTAAGKRVCLYGQNDLEEPLRVIQMREYILQAQLVAMAYEDDHIHVVAVLTADGELSLYTVFTLILLKTVRIFPAAGSKSDQADRAQERLTLPLDWVRTRTLISARGEVVTISGEGMILTGSVLTTPASQDYKICDDYKQKAYDACVQLERALPITIKKHSYMKKQDRGVLDKLRGQDTVAEVYVPAEEITIKSLPDPGKLKKLLDKKLVL